MNKFLQLPIWSVGFRPFFLLGSFYAIGIMAYWLWAFLGGGLPAHALFSPIQLHGHEMIFGFASAIIAGFLLTASANWTKTEGRQGGSLLVLVSIWLLARVGVLTSYWPLMLLDLAFLPLLILFLAPPLIRDRKIHNSLFILWLALLAAANGTMYWEAQQNMSSNKGLYLGLYIVLLLLVVVGGRVIPYFTKNAIADAQVRRYKTLDILSIVTVLLFFIADLASAAELITIPLALAAGVCNTVRWLGWKFWKTLHMPILWILSLGYFWIPVGFFLKALSLCTTAMPPTVVVHVWTVGALGTLVLGMMSRVALGHTGRKLQVSTMIVVSYAMITLATLIRAGTPLFYPEKYYQGIMLSGILWMVAFAIYLGGYFFILISPRAD